MGDILHSIPGASALRQVHPEWVIGWAVEPRWQGLFRSGPDALVRGKTMPLVDRVHLVNAKGWARRPLHPATLSEIAGVRRELREARYDVCVDLQGAVRSALIGRSAGAARMIGEDQPREDAAKWFFGERVKTTGRHVIEQSTEVLNTIAGEIAARYAIVATSRSGSGDLGRIIAGRPREGAIRGHQSGGWLGRETLADRTLWDSSRRTGSPGIWGGRKREP